jgi:integrase
MGTPTRHGASAVSHGVYSRTFRHGRTWYIRFTVAGREVKEKVGREADGFTRAKARIALQSRLGDIVQGKFRLPSVRRPVLVRALITRYREHAEAHQRGWQKTKYTLNQLEADLGHIALADLSPFTIQRWQVQRARAVKKNTVNREFNVLATMLEKAVAWKLLDLNPARSVKRFKVRDERVRYLDPAEFTRLVDAARQDAGAAWLVPAMTLAAHTGVRQGELLRLRWPDIDPRLHQVTVRTTKNTDPKHVPLNAAAEAVLAALPRSGETVLAQPWGEPVSKTTLYAAFRRVCAAAGITDFRWHDLRHTFASYLVMAGVDVPTVKELLGHRDVKSTMRYAHLSPTHKAAAVAKLEAALAPPAAEAAAAAGGAADGPRSVEDPERFRPVPSGRQTPAKRKYVADQRLREWRRGESNPRPKAHPRPLLRA